VTSINSHMGLKPAGKRSMMKLPPTRAEAARITSAKCPTCQQTGARASRTKGPGWLYCTWCNTVWEFPTKED
jgi:hypothetical protein